MPSHPSARRLRDLPPLLFGLVLLGLRPLLGVGSEGVDALPVPVVSLVATHRPHLFSILAPERSLPAPSGGPGFHPAMAQDRAKLKVSQRDTFGSRATRRLRREGLVPGVVYGQGGEARPFQVSARDLRLLLSEGQTLLDLELDDSKAVPVVIKEQQHHPVRGDVLHLDFLEVRLDEEIQSEVPIELEGADQAPGVRDGGVLEHVTREITVEALPTEIPEQITVDVSAMEINDTINLASVAIPSGVKLMADEPEEITIATLSPPRVEEEPEPEVEEEAELVGEGEEVPEGEEAPEGEAEGEAAPEGEGGGEDSGDQ